MKTARLIIKYNDRYICENIHNEIGFIWIPPYSAESCFYNVDIFIALLCSGNMSNTYEGIRALNYGDSLNIFETYFCEDYLYELEENIYMYNLQEVVHYLNEQEKNECDRNLRNLPGTLVSYSYEELLYEAKKEKEEKEILFEQGEEVPFLFACTIHKVDKELLKALSSINETRKENDVLLMYSGGKDSTLAAIRLKNAGYNVHFIHFDNGHMLDADKPYLTFQKTFANQEGYTFKCSNRAVNIETTFRNYFFKWKEEHGNNFEGYNLDSEVRCLSCRMAMYTEA
ncbi:MAG: hypothetical protein K2H20_01755, partial [Bacilli bacterium]|nr:hypothetical protein [Bacilli bacterium]